MKILLALLAAGATSFGHDLAFTWQANPEPDLIGYRLSYGTVSGAPDRKLDVGKVTAATVAGLAAGTVYYFTLTAVSLGGFESLPGTELRFDGFPAAPAGFKFAGTILFTLTPETPPPAAPAPRQ